MENNKYCIINSSFSDWKNILQNNLYDNILEATQNYIADVKSKSFPNENEQY